MPKAATPTAIEHNLETGETSEREMNELELAAYEEAKAVQAAADNAAAARAAAQAKLETLGLTAEDLKAILG